MATEEAPINPIDVLEEQGIVSVLIRFIQDVYPQFTTSGHNIVFAPVTWMANRSGWSGTFEVEGQELECEPLSPRWTVDPGKPSMSFLFQALPQKDETEGDEAGEENDEDDLTAGKWYATPLGLASSSLRARAEKILRDAGALTGRMPGFNESEWNNSNPWRLSLTFRKKGRDLMAWYNGRRFFLDRQSRRPKANVEVVVEVKLVRLHKVFVTWLGMTTDQAEKAGEDRARLGKVTGIRRATVKERPALQDPLQAMGLDIETLTGGKIRDAYSRLRKTPTNEEEAGKNTLAQAMATVNLPFKADNADWLIYYGQYLYEIKAAVEQVLRDKRAAEKAKKAEGQDQQGQGDNKPDSEGEQPTGDSQPPAEDGAPPEEGTTTE